MLLFTMAAIRVANSETELAKVATLIDMTTESWLDPYPASSLTMDPLTSSGDVVYPMDSYIAARASVPRVSTKCENVPAFHSKFLKHFKSGVVWTLSGGKAYAKEIEAQMNQWDRVGIGLKRNRFLIALDDINAQTACEVGVPVAKFTRRKRSYSSVADAKFFISMVLARHGIDFIFIEMDIWFRKSPLPLFQSLPPADLTLLRHANQENINIGLYKVRASLETTRFFQSLIEVLMPSRDATLYRRGSDKGTLTHRSDWFDQDMFVYCLVRISNTHYTHDRHYTHYTHYPHHTHYTRYIGDIPQSLCQLVNLTELSMASNELTGPIPKGLGDLVKLREIYLNDNYLVGEIPRELGQLTQLMMLYLNDNKVCSFCQSKHTLYTLYHTISLYHQG